MNSIDVNALLAEAEKKLGLFSQENNEPVPINQEINASAPSQYYAPDILSGSIYDQPISDADAALEAYLNDDQINDALDNGEDLALEELPFFNVSTTENSSEQVTAVVIEPNPESVDEGAAIILGRDGENAEVAGAASIDQVIDFALRQLELKKQKELDTSHAAIEPGEVELPQEATVEPESSAELVEELPVEEIEPEPIPSIETTLRVVADSWDKLRGIDLQRLLGNCIEIGGDHLQQLVEALTVNRQDLLQPLVDTIKEFIEDGESINPEYLEIAEARANALHGNQDAGEEITSSEQLQESQADSDSSEAVESSEKPLAEVEAKADAAEEQIEAAGNGPDKHAEEEGADTALPEGIMPLTEEHIFFSNSGKELAKFPKVFAKPATTTKKRIDWFIEQLTNESTTVAQDAIEFLTPLLADPVANYDSAFRAGCNALFGNPYGVPIENRKKTSAELKAEKEAAEEARRLEMIKKAMLRVKSPEEIQKAEEEKARIGSIIGDVTLRTGQLGFNELFKDEEPDTIKFVNESMIAPASVEKSAHTEIAVPETPVIPENLKDTHFAMIRGTERLMVGKGGLLTPDQVSALAAKEGAVLIWASSEAELDKTLQMLSGLNLVQAPNAAEQEAPVNSNAQQSVGEQLKKSDVLAQNEKAKPEGHDRFDEEVMKGARSLTGALQVSQIASVPQSRVSADLVNSSKQATPQAQAPDPQPQQEIKQPAPVQVTAPTRPAVINPVQTSNSIDPFKGVTPLAKAKIEKIVDQYKALNNPAVSCSFYSTGEGKPILAVARHEQLQQMNFYQIQPSGKMVADSELNKMRLATLIAQGKISEMRMDVEIDTKLEVNQGRAERELESYQPKSSGSFSLS